MEKELELLTDAALMLERIQKPLGYYGFSGKEEAENVLSQINNLIVAEAKEVSRKIKELTTP